MIDQQGLAVLLAELSSLTSKPNFNKADERRHAYLLSAVAAVRSGASLREIDAQRHNEAELRAGLEPTRFYTGEKETRAAAWSDFIATGKVERRDSGIGTPKPEFYNGNVGSGFVDRHFSNAVFNTLKKIDPIFDPESVTVLTTETGNVTQMGYFSDVESVAQSVTAENSDQSGNELDPSQVAAIDLKAYAYRAPLWRISIEAATDANQMISIMDLYERFVSERCSRGISRDLLQGSGVGVSLGLIPTLGILGVDAQGAVASGSSENTGGSQTSSNSIGSSDLSNLYFSVNEMYRASPRCAWWMADSTFQFVSKIVDKSGLPLVNVRDGRDVLMGKPVKISPSMPGISSNAVVCLFGAFDYWVTRRVTCGERIQVVKETPGLIERGEIALRYWTRADGALMFSSNNANSTPPIKFLQMHS